MIKFTLGFISALVLCCTLAAAIAIPTPPPYPTGGSRNCDIVRCGHGARCEMINGIPKCVCPTACPQIFQPICGSDGKTYGNTCFMNIQACRQKKEITKKYNGECTDDSSGKEIKLSTHISPGIGLPKFTTPHPCIRNPPPKKVSPIHHFAPSEQILNPDKSKNENADEDEDEE